MTSDFDSGGGGDSVFTATDTKLSPTTTPLLDDATGNEIAYNFPYTVNKATSGNDTGLLINMTDTLSPGTSLGLECKHGANTVLAVDLGNERVGIGTASPDQLLHAEKASALTNTIQQVARLSHITSGTPASGIGLGMEFEQETAADNNEIIATIEAVTTDVTATSEDADLIFKTMAAGAVAAERLRITSLGALIIQGSITLPIVTKAAGDSPYTATASDYTILCNCTAGTITINLPTAVGITGRIYNIKKTDSSTNAVTIDGSGTETIDGAATATISFQYDSYTVQSNGTNWVIV